MASSKEFLTKRFEAMCDKLPAPKKKEECFILTATASCLFEIEFRSKINAR